MFGRQILFNGGFNGISIEFTMGNITKFVNEINGDPLHLEEPTSFGLYYECSGADPNQDFRPAYSAVGLTNFGSLLDVYSVYVVACKKENIFIIRN